MYTLTDRRAWVRQFARNASDSSEYPDAQVDRALKLAGGEWSRITKAPRTLTALALTAGSNIVPALPTGFQPERMLQVFLTLAGKIIDPKFRCGSYEQVLAEQAGLGPFEAAFPVPLNATAPMSGQPRIMGFIDQVNAIVYPTPADAYAIQLWWWAPPTTWIAGAQGAWNDAQMYNYGDVVASAGTIYSCIQGNNDTVPPDVNFWVSKGAGAVDDPGALTFNLPDDALEMIDTFGAPAFLQHTEPENAYASQAFGQMQAAAKQFAARNAGGRGGQTSTKARPE